MRNIAALLVMTVALFAQEAEKPNGKPIGEAFSKAALKLAILVGSSTANLSKGPRGAEKVALDEAWANSEIEASSAEEKAVMKSILDYQLGRQIMIGWIELGRNPSKSVLTKQTECTNALKEHLRARVYSPQVGERCQAFFDAWGHR